MRLRNIPEAKEIVGNSPFVLKNPESLRGGWRTFTGGRPLHVEIGTGKGRFLMELAAREPDTAFIGVERYESVLMRAVEKMEGKPARDPASLMEARDALSDGGRKEEAAPDDNSAETEAAAFCENLSAPAEGLAASDGSSAPSEGAAGEEAFVPPSNLHFLRMDARELPAVFGEGEVDRIYLNFSDPWPKARHEKRRLTSRNFLALYEKFLVKGGTLEFKTDNRDLFEFSVGEFEAAPGWTITAITRDLYADPVLGAANVMTEYERKFSALGNRICKLVAVFHREPAGEATD